MTSPTRKQLVDFVSGRASHDDAEDLFHQLSEDEQLQRRVRAIQLIQSDFDSAWQVFNAIVAEAGGRLDLDPARLTIVGAIRALVDGANSVATGAGARLRELAEGAIAPIEASFEPVLGAASPQAAVAYEHARRASELIGEGADERARSELQLATTHNRGVAERAILVLRQRGAVVGEAQIDAAERTVTVTLEPQALTNVEQPVAVIHFGEGELEDVRSQRFSLVNDRWLATFEDVPDGVILLQIAAE